MVVIVHQNLVDKARRWIQVNRTDIGNKFFEDVAETYPGDYFHFMLAWCEEMGGI